MNQNKQLAENKKCKDFRQKFILETPKESQTYTGFYPYTMMIALFAVIMIMPYMVYWDHPWWDFLFQPVTILLPTLGAVWIYKIKTQKAWGDVLPLRKISGKTLLLLTLIVFLIPPIVNYVGDLFYYLVTDPWEEYYLFTPGEEPGLWYAIQTFVYGSVYFAVLPGVCEELLFRGALMSMMKDARWRLGLIVLVNGLLFGIFHGNLEQLFYTTAMGFVLVGVVDASQSLLGSIYVHTAYNLLVSLYDLFLVEEHPLLNRVYQYTQLTPNLLVAALFALAVVFVLRYLKKSVVLSQTKALGTEKGKSLEQTKVI